MVNKYISIIGEVILIGLVSVGYHYGFNEVIKLSKQERVERQNKIESKKVVLRGKVLDRYFDPGNFIDLARLTLCLEQDKIIFTQKSIFDGDTNRNGYTVPYSQLLKLNDSIPKNGYVEVIALKEDRDAYTGLDAKLTERK